MDMYLPARSFENPGYRKAPLLQGGAAGWAAPVSVRFAAACRVSIVAPGAAVDVHQPVFAPAINY